MKWSINMVLKEFQWKTKEKYNFKMLTAKNKQSKFKRHSSFVFCQITSDIECGSLKSDKKRSDWNLLGAFFNIQRSGINKLFWCWFFHWNKNKVNSKLFGFPHEKPSIDFKQKMEVVSDCWIQCQSTLYKYDQYQSQFFQCISLKGPSSNF